MKSTAFIGAFCLFLTACQGPLPVRNSPANVRAQMTAQQAAQQAASQNDITSQTRLQANARLFEQPVPVSVTPDTLIFKNLDTPLEVGQVVMGRSLDGEDFLRRVTRLRSTGNTTYVSTTNASLFDAFQELQVTGVDVPRSPQRIALRSQRFNIGGVMDIVVDLGVRPDFSDARIQLKNSRLKVHMSPRFELDTQIRSELTFLRPTQSDLQPVGSVEFTAARFPAWIGPVPVVFRIKPGAALSWGHQASGELIQALNIDGFIKPRVELEAALKQAPRAKGTIQQQIQARMEPVELRFKGNAHARLHIPQIQFESELAGIVGPFISAGTYVDARYQKQVRTPQGRPVEDTEINADLGLSVYGGITPTRLFGSDLTREIRVRILEKNLKKLYHKKNSEPLS